MTCPAMFFKSALPFDHVFCFTKKLQFSRLTSDLLHPLFQLNGFSRIDLSPIKLHYVVNTGKVKKSESEETG